MFIIEKLIEKAKNGDKIAIDSIIDKYKGLILKEASRYNIIGYEFEDIVQHGYLSVIKAINLYKLGSNSFNGYCINSIKNNFRALLKGEIKHFREVPNELLYNLDQKDGYEFTLEDEVIAFDQTKRLYDALERLDPLEKEIIERYYIKEESLTEIACDGEYSYRNYFRIKDKALGKLRKWI